MGDECNADGGRGGGGLGFRLGTLVGGVVGSAVGLFLVLPVGLVVIEWVVFPLALGVASVLEGLVAGWAGNRLAGDGSRTDLLRVVGATEVAAGVIAIVVLISAWLRVALLGPVAVVALGCMVVLGVAAAVGTWRFRRSGVSAVEEGDGRLTAALLGAALVSVPIVVGIAWLLGWAGA